MEVDAEGVGELVARAQAVWGLAARAREEQAEAEPIRLSPPVSRVAFREVNRPASATTRRSDSTSRLR